MGVLGLLKVNIFFCWFYFSVLHSCFGPFLVMGVYNFNLWKYVAQCLPFTAPMAANFICFLLFLLIKKKACNFWKCVILSLFCVLLIFYAGLVKSSGKRIEAEVKWREDKPTLLYLGIFNLWRGYLCTSPFTKFESFLKCAFRKSQFFFNKSAFLKSQYLHISFKTCVLKNLSLDNVGPNSAVFTFWAEDARYWVENVGPNPP